MKPYHLATDPATNYYLRDARAYRRALMSAELEAAPHCEDMLRTYVAELAACARAAHRAAWQSASLWHGRRAS